MRNLLRQAAFIFAGAVLLSALAGCEKPAATSAPPRNESARAGAGEAPADNFEIHGERMRGVPDGATIVLLIPPYGPGQEERRIEAQVKDGAFVLSGRIDQPAPGMLYIQWPDEKRYESAPMIVEHAGYQVEFLDDLVLVTKGGEYNDRIFAYRQFPEYLSERQRYKREMAKFSKLDMMDEAAVKRARKEMEVIRADNRADQIRRDYLWSLIDEASLPALLKLLAMSDFDSRQELTEEKESELLDLYQKTLGPHPLILQRRAAMAESAANEKTREESAVGARYKDIVARDADGKAHRLSDVLAANELVLLDFWASWCSPCRGEFPHLAKVYREFNGRGFEIFAVSLDAGEKEWRKALEEEMRKGNVPWVNLRDEGAMESTSAKAYGVTQLPNNVLIASDGTILARNLREFAIEREIRARMQPAGKAR
ncbi:TlpA disulfide reductase family protein [Solilutibacter pythonis]|nr:TlpA disulfide reductase family protein [Lysobacter pythonis]